MAVMDEAKSGHIADRPQARLMLDEAGRTSVPFQVFCYRGRDCGIRGRRASEP